VPIGAHSIQGWNSGLIGGISFVTGKKNMEEGR
jgi:hypothetical protein